MAEAEYARKTVRLRRTGGSQSVVLPRAWLRRLGAIEEVEMVETESAIIIRAVPEKRPTIEDEPDFAQFLEFLARDALRNPARLGDVGELVSGDEELFDGVEAD